MFCLLKVLRPRLPIARGTYSPLCAPVASSLKRPITLRGSKQFQTSSLPVPGPTTCPCNCALRRATSSNEGPNAAKTFAGSGSNPAKTFPGSPPRPRFAAAVYRTAIAEKLDAGLSLQRIWQDLVEEYGYGASYESVKRFVRTIAPTRRAVGVFHCAPGAEAQVDFFRGAPTLDAADRRVATAVGVSDDAGPLAPTAALLLAVFLRAARLRRQRREAPVRGEREIDVVTIGIEEARAHDGRFEIVVANDQRHAAEIAEGALVQPEKRLELLIPDRLFVASWTVRSPLAKTGNASPASGWSARCSTATKCVHTWRRVVP